ncbi:hypothetical protein HGRIS_007258 [Hohenbuehelia grisea]|uniref:Uncharacterized protein n=1 Tax=Hohenbuehelia grisea TaxID=104357 RepID=A0ABR3JC60_9AGAR
MSLSKSTADMVLRKMMDDYEDPDFEAAWQETNEYFRPKSQSIPSVSSSSSRHSSGRKSKGKSKAPVSRTKKISQVVLLTCGTVGGRTPKTKKKPKLSRIQHLEQVGLASSKVDGTTFFTYPTDAGPKKMNAIFRDIIPDGFRLMAKVFDAERILTIDDDDTKPLAETKKFPYFLAFLEQGLFSLSQSCCGMITGGVLLQCVNKQGTSLQHAVVYLVTRSHIPDSELPKKHLSSSQTTGTDDGEHQQSSEDGSDSEKADGTSANGLSEDSASEKSNQSDSEGSSDFWLEGKSKPKVAINLHNPSIKRSRNTSVSPVKLRPRAKRPKAAMPQAALFDGISDNELGEVLQGTRISLSLHGSLLGEAPGNPWTVM